MLSPNALIRLEPYCTLKRFLWNAAATFRLVDFGLSRRFVDDSHQPMPERLDTAFRGSTTYASVNAHLGKDLSRRDDLWSWLYILVEMLDGAAYAAALCCSLDGDRWL